MPKIKCAIIGSGNIGTDLMIKIMKTSDLLEVSVMVGIDPNSDGLARAKRLGVSVTAEGMDGLVCMDEWKEIKLVFDATTAYAHMAHDAACKEFGKIIIDLTPAAIGPYTVPVVNLDDSLELSNVNMVTCGGQATIPIVAAISSVAEVHYAEIIASISSKSAGPGTRANIDEFTETTSRAIEQVGGAKRGKAIIILNPAEPPVLMRDTVLVLSEIVDEKRIEAAVEEMVKQVQSYVPGYRLKQKIQFERFGSNNPLKIPGYGEFEGIKTSVYLEVEGAAHYLPAYAGNLDIMTSAAMGTGEKIVKLKFQKAA
ncbi:MAG: acetaldehyde dehydrogenase (acetylating) [Emcibacteraceae bacterium]|nr:acetaldehyde dehydrogenase (acetylating) [Emcibacteraceae bacterium]